MTIEAQLSKLLYRRVFQAVMTKATNVLEPVVLEKLEERWMGKVGASLYSTNSKLSGNEETLVNGMVASTDHNDTSSCSVASTVKDMDGDLTTRCRNAKRLREEVPLLPPMRSVQGLYGLPLKSDTSSQSAHKLNKVGVGSGIVSGDSIRVMYTLKPTNELSLESTKDAHADIYSIKAFRNRADNNKNKKLGVVRYAQSHPITFGTRVRIESNIDNRVRVGRVVNFPELNIIRVRYPSGLEELVQYPHSMHSHDENLNYDEIGLAQDVDAVINSGEGVRQFIDRDELDGNVNEPSSKATNNTVHENGSNKYEKILLNASQGYVVHFIKVEELKKFDDIDDYFNKLNGKPTKVTVNREVGRNVSTKKCTVSNKRLPKLTNDDNPEYGRDFLDEHGLVIGESDGRVVRRSADWLVKLHDVVINVNNENLLFKSLAVRIDPSNLVSTPTNVSDYNLYRL